MTYEEWAERYGVTVKIKRNNASGSLPPWNDGHWNGQAWKEMIAEAERNEWTDRPANTLGHAFEALAEGGLLIVIPGAHEIAGNASNAGQPPGGWGRRFTTS